MSITFYQSLRNTVSEIDTEMAELAKAREVIIGLLPEEEVEAAQTNAGTNGGGQSERPARQSSKRTTTKARKSSGGKPKATGSTRRGER